MSNMEVDYPIQDFEFGGGGDKAMAEVISKNFNTIVNIIQNHEMYDMIHLNHLHELCQVLHVMINDCTEDINLFSENNKLVGSFRDAGLDMNNISSRRNKLFSTLTPWQLRDTLDQLETVLNFLTDARFGVMNDFKINNLFSIYKINNVGDLINSVHGFLNSHYRFGSNIQADFSIMIKDGKTIDEVIKKYKKEKYLNDINRRKIKDLLSNHLVYEISFHFGGLGLPIKPLKNF
uniref:ORF9 p27 n=1 Tax=Lettuce chlorosis virus TaxID=642478 RepID=A0A5C1IUF5_9CLOS|nr:ORF9 p27 [Lettuce chlorosis virus]